MGHFSYTCQLSGVPITDGDRAVLLPIFPKSKWGYNSSQEHMSKYGQGSLISNDGANMYFDELFFPIFGTYDSYGKLENIERDDNTVTLEEFFELTIDEIASVITDNRRDEYEKDGKYCDSVKILKKDNSKHMMLLKTSATWFSRDVYDKITKIKVNDYFDKVELGEHGILIALGFEHIGVDKSESRYKNMYKKGDLIIHSDGSWLNLNSVYDIKEFKKYCAKFNVDIDEKIISGGYYSQLYDFVLSHTNNIIDFSDNDELRRMFLSDIYTSIPNYSLMRKYTKLLDDDTKNNLEKEIQDEYNNLINQKISFFYFHKVKENGDNFLKKNIVDWFNFKSYFYATGRFLYPIGTSAQDGDHKRVKILMEVALDVTKDYIDKYNGEDEDGE